MVGMLEEEMSPCGWTGVTGGENTGSHYVDKATLRLREILLSLSPKC